MSNTDSIQQQVGCALHVAAHNNIEFRNRFDELVAQWERETALSSFTQFMCSYPAYQQIIEMGELVLPLVLKEVKDNGHWHWALCVITGKNPAQDSRCVSRTGAFSTRDIRATAKAWVQWGREHCPCFEWV